MNRNRQLRSGYHYKAEGFYTAIVATGSMQPLNLLFVKYRNVDGDKPEVLERFKKFLRSQFGEVHYINFYGGVSRNFIRRENM